MRSRRSIGVVGVGVAAAGAMASAGPDAAGLDPEIASRPLVECVELETLDRSTWRGTLWPGGRVPYVFSSNTTTQMQAAMCEAMEEIHWAANITFVPRTTESNYIVIQNSTGNNSYVGMIGGGQTINIYNWNYKFIMCHELMHALGETHEQSRPDRDAYIRINAANICQTCCSGNPCNGNFNISASATTVGPYDFESVMHYGPTAFSINGQPTIECIPPYTQYQSVIGNRGFLSVLDKAGLAFRYGAPIDDPYEPNDTVIAVPALAGTSATLWLNDRSDYFQVTIGAAGATFSVLAYGAAVAEAGALSLYRPSTPSPILLATQALASVPGSGESGASMTLPLSAGTYLVRVHRGCGQGGQYTLEVPPRCPADVDRSGAVSVQDMFTFLGLYFAGTLPHADFNGTAGISVQDIFDFLAAYFAGCT